MKQARVTVVQAERDWLQACAHLRATTLASYAGEARRFREHLARAGIDAVQEIAEADWAAYLVDLTKARATIDSKRSEALKLSSALQAARITRSFLRHCWTRRWLDWAPSLGSQRCPPAPPATQFHPPAGLLDFLLHPGEVDDEVRCRLRCTVALSFWGGFRPKEIADLRVRDLAPAADGSAWLLPAWREHAVALPAVMVQQLHRYAGLRALRTGSLGADAPLIAHIRSAGPIGAGTAWQLLRGWTVAYAPPGGAPHSTRAIRETFKQLAGADSERYLSAVEHQAAGRRRLSPVPRRQPVSTAQVVADLLRKMASTQSTA